MGCFCVLRIHLAVESIQRKDTPLHIAIRARSVRIASLLLRKPQDARILYQPNADGETPYNLDASHNKSILASIFGASKSRGAG